MKRTNFFAVTLTVIALAAVGAMNLHAQAGVAPSSQLGVGVTTNGPAATVQYAISPSLILGAGLSYANSDGNSSTGIEVFGRFLLEGTVNPIIQVGFQNRSISGASTSASSLYGALGMQYFMNRNVGIYGLVNLLDLPLETGGKATFGLVATRMGLEWYFNK